jgi:hypothetical protein
MPTNIYSLCYSRQATYRNGAAEDRIFVEST